MGLTGFDGSLWEDSPGPHDGSGPVDGKIGDAGSIPVGPAPPQSFSLEKAIDGDRCLSSLGHGFDDRLRPEDHFPGGKDFRPVGLERQRVGHGGDSAGGLKLPGQDGKIGVLADRYDDRIG